MEGEDLNEALNKMTVTDFYSILGSIQAKNVFKRLNELFNRTGKIKEFIKNNEDGLEEDEKSNKLNNLRHGIAKFFSDLQEFECEMGKNNDVENVRIILRSMEVCMDEYSFYIENIFDNST